MKEGPSSPIGPTISVCPSPIQWLRLHSHGIYSAAPAANPNLGLAPLPPVLRRPRPHSQDPAPRLPPPSTSISGRAPFSGGASPPIPSPPLALVPCPCVPPPLGPSVHLAIIVAIAVLPSLVGGNGTAGGGTDGDTKAAFL